MTIALTLEKFIRFETNGMSCRRISPPPSVYCSEKEPVAINPCFM
jgi:hypothetical protein